jgi:hypothetical protein
MKVNVTCEGCNREVEADFDGESRTCGEDAPCCTEFLYQYICPHCGKYGDIWL